MLNDLHGLPNKTLHTLSLGSTIYAYSGIFNLVKYRKTLGTFFTRRVESSSRGARSGFSDLDCN